MNIYNLCIILAFLLKFGFIILSGIHLYYKIKDKSDTEIDIKVVYWKDRFEFLFIALMSVLLIYLFNPTTNKLSVITPETKLLFFLFGFVLLITANWEDFIKESKLVIYFQNLV